MRSKGVGGVRGRQASPRALAIAGAVVVIAAIAIVLGVVLSGGGGGGGSQVVTDSDMQGLPAVGSQNWPGALQGAGEANDLYKGIPQHGQALGKPKAKVEMQMFIDVQCPICQDYETNSMATVVNRYIRPGRVQMTLKPWAFLGGAGSQSFSGRLGVIAAAYQNKGYEYAKVLYDNQGAEESGWLTGQTMARIAASVTGLNLAEWQKDANSAAAQSTASDVDKLATQDKVLGTPTILVGPPGGPLRNVETASELAVGNAPTLQDTERALDKALSGT